MDVLIVKRRRINAKSSFAPEDVRVIPSGCNIAMRYVTYLIIIAISPVDIEQAEQGAYVTAREWVVWGDVINTINI